MKIAGNSFEEFHNVAHRKKIIAFGASDFLRVISLNYKDLWLDHYIDSVADNDIGKQGGCMMVNGSRKHIISPDNLREYDVDSFAVLISSDAYAYEIYRQLDAMLGDKAVDIFVLPMMISAHMDDATEKYMLERRDEKRKIPKTIHYFWFSGEKKDELSLKCIESWKKACPEYELKEWNSSNYDVTANPFAYEAYKQGKWAYVSDYARLDTVYKYGGIYLDLDVFLYKNLDVLLKNDFFVGFGPIRDIEAAIFGAVKGQPAVKEMMDIYRDREFDVDTSMRLPNLQPILLDRFFESKGFKINGKYQQKDGMTIFPRDLFSAKNWFTGEYEVTDAALGVHECAGGWVGKNGKGSKQIRAEGIRKLEGLYKEQKMDECTYKGDTRRMIANTEEL
ncbi:MAG: hypothetical protein HFH87_01000 [Lachnospiraceae bacterium]|nr:hypothetical protein [Lachnospiraceae bacterium]